MPSLGAETQNFLKAVLYCWYRVEKSQGAPEAFFMPVPFLMDLIKTFNVGNSRPKPLLVIQSA